MSTESESGLPVVELPSHGGQSTLVQTVASTAPVLFVVLLFLGLVLIRLYSGGRSSARRKTRWFVRYWQSFLGINYNPSSKSTLRKRNSRPPES